MYRILPWRFRPPLTGVGGPERSKEYQKEISIPKRRLRPPRYHKNDISIPKNQGPLNGGVSNGGVSRSGLVLPFCPFLSFLGLSRFFWDFPDLLGDGPGIFPICPFPLSRPIKSTHEEQSRKGPRHNLDLSRKSGKHPGLETPRFSFSQKKMHPEFQVPSLAPKLPEFKCRFSSLYFLEECPWSHKPSLATQRSWERA